MAGDLSQTLERLDFSKSQLPGLQVQLREYVNRAIMFRVDTSEPPWSVVRVTLQEPFPVSVAEHVGQIVGTTRACLDALVARLAVRSGKTSSGVQFPIPSTEAQFADATGNALRKLSENDRQAIIGLGIHGESNPLLYGFHQFNNKWKHREELPLGATAQSGMGIQEVFGGIQMAIPAGILELGKEVDILASIPNGDERYNFYTDAVFFDPPALGGMRIIDGLAQFNDEVRRILTYFIR